MKPMLAATIIEKYTERSFELGAMNYDGLLTICIDLELDDCTDSDGMRAAILEKEFPNL